MLFKLAHKQFYRCNVPTTRADEQCKAGCYINYPKANSTAGIFRTTCEHTHDDKQRRGVPEAEKEKILDLVLAQVTRPKLIVNALERAHEKLQKAAFLADPTHVIVAYKPPATTQIQSFLSHNKKKTTGLGAELGELSHWCREHSGVPDNIDEPFVVKHQIFYEDSLENYGPEDDYQEGDIFRFYISTIRLIRLSSMATEVINCDATYKLNWNNFPVSGTTLNSLSWWF
jgi:hypothetical protein